MIYLLQDCYEDSEGNYHKVLKIGYSKKPFGESRENQYRTHNYGFKLLFEKGGSQELEHYLQNLFKNLRLDREWFKYSEDIIKKFQEVEEDEINLLENQSLTQEDINERIRYTILKDLVPTPERLKKLYLEGILEDLRKESVNTKDIVYDESLCKKEILEVFSLVCSKERKYFENLDFNSLEIQEELKKCSLDLPQIVGRQRNRENPFKNDIVLFYKTKRKGEIELTEEAFQELQRNRRSESLRVLNVFNNIQKDDEKKMFMKKLGSDIKVSQYSDDFISISKNTNLPVYNYLIEIANERAWEVAQKDYQDTITVTKALEEQGYVQEKYKSRDEVIVKDFLNNKFYKTGIFKEKMKLYCEFRDLHKDNQEIINDLSFKIEDQKYRLYYEYYGTSGCRARNFQEKDLERGWRDATLEDKLVLEINSKFKPGDRFTLKEAKSWLSEVYASLGISKTAKAKDLEKYFNLTKTRITLPDKRVLDGFKITGIK